MNATLATAAKSKGESKPTAPQQSAPEVAARQSSAQAWAFGKSGGLHLQRKCACGGTCAHCQAEEETLKIQRKADENAPAPSPEISSVTEPVTASGATTESLGLIVEDDQTASDGQMRRAEFVAQLRGQMTPICDEELAPAGRSAQGCPYIVYWLDYASGLSASKLERSIRRFTATGADTPQGLIDAVVSRVRAAVRLWVVTGQVATPKALGAVGSLTGFTSAVGNLVSGLFGEDSTPAGGAVQQKAEVSGAPPASANLRGPTAVRNQLGAGHGLDPGVRSRMEQGFGRSFAGVRIHTDSTASNLAGGLSAHAFTVGNNIAFKSGAYRPGNVAGDLLIAHELAHTVQQEGATGDTVLPMDQEHRLEDDADRAAVGAVGSLLGITGQMTPTGKSGLRLQGCQEVKLRCPKGYSWRVQSTAGFGSFGCTCFWKCLPGEPPGYSAPSNNQTVRCPPEMNCSSGVRYETLSDDYEKKGYGAAITPLGEQAYCGCFPLNFEGEKVSDAPLKANDFELTDVVGPLADMAAARRGGQAETDSTTGTRLPDKRGKGTTKPSSPPTRAPEPVRFTTKPMNSKYFGEDRPGNPLWSGKTVKYLTDAERTQYKLQFKDGKIFDAAGKPFDTASGTALASGPGNAIFIMDGLGNFYASNYQAIGEFHHSSLAAGQPVAAAGEMRVENGVLKSMTDRSGHYQPTPDMRAQAEKALKANGIDPSGKVKAWDKP